MVVGWMIATSLNMWYNNFSTVSNVEAISLCFAASDWWPGDVTAGGGSSSANWLTLFDHTNHSHTLVSITLQFLSRTTYSLLFFQWKLWTLYLSLTSQVLRRIILNHIWYVTINPENGRTVSPIS